MPRVRRALSTSGPGAELCAPFAKLFEATGGAAPLVRRDLVSALALSLPFGDRDQRCKDGLGGNRLGCKAAFADGRRELRLGKSVHRASIAPSDGGKHGGPHSCAAGPNNGAAPGPIALSPAHSTPQKLAERARIVKRRGPKRGRLQRRKAMPSPAARWPPPRGSFLLLPLTQ
jgi:hypothetical protein